jgi:hypothetical protein
MSGLRKNTSQPAFKTRLVICYQARHRVLQADLTEKQACELWKIVADEAAAAEGETNGMMVSFLINSPQITYREKNWISAKEKCPLSGRNVRHDAAQGHSEHCLYELPPSPLLVRTRFDFFMESEKIKMLWKHLENTARKIDAYASCDQLE